MTNLERAQQILAAMGGADNVSFACHCATRLRLTINDESRVNRTACEAVPGVLGFVKNNDEYHIIIGTSVPALFAEFSTLGDFEKGDAIDDPKTAAADQAKQDKASTNWFLKATDFIAGSVLPALPVIVAGGMVSAVLVICTTFFGMSSETGTYRVLNAIYTAAFFFLPIYVGYNAAAKLKCSPMLGALLGGVLVCADINGVEGLDFLGIPVTAASYNGGIIPVLLGALFMQFIYKPLDKVIPEEVKFFIVPLLTMIVTVPVTLIALGPLGNWVGELLGQALGWLNATLGWLSVGILGAIFALTLYTGTSYGLYAFVITGFATNGYEAFVQPAGLAANLAVGGAAIAVFTMLKDKEQKGMALSTGLTAVFGITEPAIFGVLGGFRRPFIGAIAGGGIAGLFAGLTHVAEYAFVSPGVASALAFINPDGSMENFIFAICTMIIAFVVAFVVTRLAGIKESE